MAHSPNTFFSPGFPPPPHPSFWGGLRRMFEKSPILTILGGLVLMGCLEENRLLKPALVIGFISLVFHLMNPRPRFDFPHPLMNPAPPPPPPPKPVDSMTPLAATTPELSGRMEHLEKQISQIRSAGHELFKRTETLKKSRPWSILAIFSFFFGIGSLSIPLALFGFVLCFSYLNHAEISPIFLHLFNGLHLDQVLFHLQFVDFDFFAMFFGAVLIPASFLVMISLGISLRTLFKRQRGFFLAFFGTGLFFLSFLSLAGAWSGLMHSAHKWQEEWQEIAATPIGGTQNTVDYFQKKFEDSRTPFWKKFEDSRAPFWNRFIAIKALKKINTPEAYQALFQELNRTNSVLQQLILRQLEGQVTLQQAPQIESLLEETSDRRFHQVGIHLLTTIPEKEMTIRLLNMSIPLPPETLMNRFTKEDVPQLLTKLCDPANCQKTAIFNALYSIDEEQALKSLETLASSQDIESQRVVLQWIQKNPAHPQRNNFLNQLCNSSFADIQYPAKYLQEHSQKKSPKHSKRVRRSCQEEKD